jgi:hypothetical protein
VVVESTDVQAISWVYLRDGAACQWTFHVKWSFSLHKLLIYIKDAIEVKTIQNLFPRPEE